MRTITFRGFLRRLRPSVAARRSSLHGQRGFALIEVIVSAALLAVVAGGVFAGIDGPAAISGENQSRSVASDLAQQDQDRLRGMTITALTGYTNTRTVPLDGVSYSVYSKAIWLRDASDSSSCTIAQDDNSGDYLKITSRVTAANATPVELDSLLAPPPGSVATNKGTLAVQLKNQLDAPIVGQSVAITGPQTMSVPTNSSGCAVFGLVTKGTYTVTYSKTGWVDPDGVNAVSFPTSVTAGSTSVITKNYAQAATLNVAVDTAVPGIAGTAASPAKAITLINSGLTAGSKVISATVSNQTSWSVPVYPFATSSYSVWAGGCSAGDPTKYGKAPITAQPAPGATVGLTVRQPSINVTSATGVPSIGTYSIISPPQSGAHMVYTSLDSGCSEKYSQITAANGRVPYPGTPYGNWKVCADFSGSYAQQDTFLNSNPAGTNVAVPYKGNGTCP